MKNIFDKEKDNQAIATMQSLALDSINNAKGGHLGMAIGAAPITYTLYTKQMNINLQNPKWINRDRFVLSAGHGSMSIYSIMNLLGILSIDDLKNHKILFSRTPSHPEIEACDFVDANTGPLGQGIAMAVGMAISQKYLQGLFNKKNFNIFDHYVYVLHGDGCIQEGVASEALQLAGTLQLDRLIVLHDFNNIQIDSQATFVNNIDLIKYYEAMNFKTFVVKNPTVENINKAIQDAKNSHKPTYIQIQTKIATNTKYENTLAGHSNILNPEETIAFKQQKNIETLEPFEYSKNVYEYVQKHWEIKDQNYLLWSKMFEKYKRVYPYEYEKIQLLFNNKIKFDFTNITVKNTNEAIRNYFKKYIFNIENKYWNVIGGSADLSNSTCIHFDKSFQNQGQGIYYGIREFAMTAINNGIYLDSNLRTIDSTFLAFADYAKAAIRLGAIMNIPSIHIYTHDSYQVGGDGPTHQPFDQLPMLRSMANVEVYRPSNAFETHYAFTEAFNDLKHQSVIIGSRQNINLPEMSLIDCKEANVICDFHNFDLNILASGSEVELAMHVSKNLQEKFNIYSRVISVVNLQKLIINNSLCMELKLDQKPIFVIEASSETMWFKLSQYNKVDAWLANSYGYSADGPIVYKEKGFNVENITDRILTYLSIKKENNEKIK